MKRSALCRCVAFSMFLFHILSIIISPAFAQQMAGMNADSANGMGIQMSSDEEIAHPFFTHMGMPEAVGTYSLRLAGLATRMDDKTSGDFAFHFETGLSKIVGLHIRNDRFLDNTHSEVMFQFGVIRSNDGMSGFSPIMEFEFPTKKGASGINTLVGFSTAFVESRFAFNQVIHYNPREDMVDGSAALVYKVSSIVFLAGEILGEKMPDEQAIINLLIGAKIKLNDNFMFGIGYQLPITSNKQFTSQYIFQPDMEWKN